MTKELKEVLEKIDLAFINHFKDDKEVKTIFVAGSMAHDDYIDRQDNDYDIRVISNKVTKEQIVNFEQFLQDLSSKLTQENLAVGYSCLVGPVNHKVSNTKKNVLIHAMIHEREQMDDFLPVTHKYQYGTRYRIVAGVDSLKRFQDIRYNIDDILNAHEGLRYCIDMLKNNEYRYLTWDIDEDCEFNFHTVEMPEDTILENCFYSVNKFLSNLANYCNWNNYIIPEDKLVFAVELLGTRNLTEKNLFLLHGLITKDEKLLNKVFDNPKEEVIKLLKILETNIHALDSIFPKKAKSKKLIKK